MKVAGLLSEIVGSMFHRAATVRYPAVEAEAPLRLRGPVQWDRLRCTGCGVCVMDCPANALELLVIDKKTRRFVLSYHIDRCTFCGQCTESCKQDALWMSHSDWELATADPRNLTVRYGSTED